MHSKRQFIFAKLISVFLSVIILVFSIPFGVADGYEPLAADPISGNRSKPDVIEWEESRPVLEMMDKRGEFEKHYVTSDGKLIAVTYAESIHYLDECGDYRDIDASLLLDGQVYRAQIGDYRVNLPAILSADSNLTIQNGKESLQWALSAETIDGEILQCAESEAELVECKDDYDNLDDPNGPAFALPNVTSSALYSKAFAGQDNLDVRYTVSYNRIEEDVIFRGRSNVSAFSITVLSEHSPAVNENGSIDFLNTDGRIEFSVGSPYLMDAKLKFRIPFPSPRKSLKTNTELGTRWIGTGSRMKTVPTRSFSTRPFLRKSTSQIL